MYSLMASMIRYFLPLTPIRMLWESGLTNLPMNLPTGPSPSSSTTPSSSNGEEKNLVVVRRKNKLYLLEPCSFVRCSLKGSIYIP